MQKIHQRHQTGPLQHLTRVPQDKSVELPRVRNHRISRIYMHFGPFCMCSIRSSSVFFQCRLTDLGCNWSDNLVSPHQAQGRGHQLGMSSLSSQHGSDDSLASFNVHDVLFLLTRVDYYTERGGFTLWFTSS